MNRQIPAMPAAKRTSLVCDASASFTGMRGHWLFSCIALCAGLSGAAQATESEVNWQQVVAQFSVDSIKSVEVADAALAAVQTAREKVQRTYSQEEGKCAPKFFVASCIEKAAEQRREALGSLRPIEVAAARFKRQESVNQRDAELAEKQSEHAIEVPERLREAKAREQELLAREKKIKEQTSANQAAYEAAKRAADLAHKQQEAQAKVNQRAAKQASEAQLRAENVLEFEKKQQESEKKQQDLAKRQQEKKAKLAAQEKARQEKLEKDQAKAKAKVQQNK